MESDLKSKLEMELENELRKSFEQIPLIMLEDQVTLYKKIVDRLADEYIQKGKRFKEEWALAIVKGMIKDAIPPERDKAEEKE